MDAKSILGICSLNMHDEMELKVHSGEFEKLKNQNPQIHKNKKEKSGIRKFDIFSLGRYNKTKQGRFLQGRERPFLDSRKLFRRFYKWSE